MRQLGKMSSLMTCGTVAGARHSFMLPENVPVKGKTPGPERDTNSTACGVVQASERIQRKALTLVDLIVGLVELESFLRNESTESPEHEKFGRYRLP